VSCPACRSDRNFVRTDGIPADDLHIIEAGIVVVSLLPASFTIGVTRHD
jgi:hypothetical protein